MTFLLNLPPEAWAAPAVPTGLSLTAGETSIATSWTANSAPVTGYNLYYGTSSGTLNSIHPVNDGAATFSTISGLTRSTTYYVAMTAFYNITSESSRTAEVSTKTLADEPPAAPEDFEIRGASFITISSVDLRWTLNTEPDMSHYIIYGKIAFGTYSAYRLTADSTVNSEIISGLSSATRYVFALSAEDTAGNESAKSSPIIVDILPDSDPPDVPANLSASITGSRQVTVTFSGNNAAMADLSGFRLYMGISPAPEGYAIPIDLGTNTSSVQSDLMKDTTYYFTVTAYDVSGNESAASAEFDLLVEDLEGFLAGADIKEGCFIATAVFGSYDHPAVKLLRQFRDRYLLTHKPGKIFVDYYYTYGPRAAGIVSQHNWLKYPVFVIMIPLLLLACFMVKAGLAPALFFFAALPLVFRKRKILGMTALILFFPLFNQAGAREAINPEPVHKIGLKGGYFLAAEERQRDIYDERMSPVTLFYDYSMNRNFSLEAEAGYIVNKGYARTTSGQPTNVETEMMIAPLSATVKWSFELTELIKPFVGAGVDYWYVKETIGPVEFKKKVGGYHTKVGVVFYQPPDHAPFSGGYEDDLLFIVEVVNAVIDRFGDNKTDLGGWMFNVGVGYQF